jgi:hypothetical protein
MHKNIGIVPLELLLIENGECSKLITNNADRVLIGIVGRQNIAQDFTLAKEIEVEVLLLWMPLV